MNSFSALGNFYELIDLCKGYGQAYFYCQSLADRRIADRLLRLFKGLTPEQRYLLSYF